MPKGTQGEMLGITRLTPKRGRPYWWVSVSRRRRSFTKAFRDRKYGGEEAALLAAKRYRDELLLAHLPMSRREFCVKVRSNNTSGIPGVTRWVHPHKPMACWRATTGLTDGRVLTKSFSVNCYGEEKAKRLAIQARKLQLEQVKGLHCFSRDLPAKIEQLQRASRKGRADRDSVTRVNEGSGGPGWRARVSWNGSALESWFPDQRHGGRKPAMRVAMAWRDRMTDPRKPITVAEFAAIRRSSNTSGVPGVYRTSYSQARKDGSIKVNYWRAYVPTAGGKHKVLSFRIEKYGEEEAYRRAVEVRLRQLADQNRPLRRGRPPFR